MTVHKLSTLSNLEDLALELGASVRYEDGRVFNSSARSGVRRLPAQPPAPTPAPAPVPVAVTPKEDSHAALLQKVVELLARPQPTITLPEFKFPAPVAAPVPPAVAAKPVVWRFDFERNYDGTLKSITAKPQL